MARPVVLLLCLLFSLSSTAQNSVISGKAKNYAKQTLRAFAYDDNLTLKEKEIGKTTIDSAGNFQLSLALNSTALVFLKTNISRSSFYVEPGKNYLVSIPAIPPQEITTLALQAYSPLKINSADSLELNNLIRKFEVYLDDFYTKNIALIARKGIKKEAVKFRQAMEKRFSFSTNTYFKNYIKYKIATLEAAGGYNERYLFKNYFSASISYSSLEYMQFFNQTFTKHLEQLAGTSKGANIENNISNRRNYSACMQDILKADTLFKNDTLRELLLLKGLNEYYYLPKINKKNVLSLLAFIKKNGLSADNKKIAGNTISLLTLMAVDSKAPEFELPDVANKLIKLSDFKGKYVYLDFWATWCTPCLQEMKLKQQLKDKYGSDIVFISISLDKKVLSMKDYLSKNKNLNSIFLFAGESSPIKETYNIKAIPSYFIIDREGDLVKSPAKKPSENIEPYFQEIIKRN
jgi:thiol-disulfide isomerase/thioredoxin